MQEFICRSVQLNFFFKCHTAFLNFSRVFRSFALPLGMRLSTTADSNHRGL